MITFKEHELIEELMKFYDAKSMLHLVLIQNQSITKLQQENARLTSFVSPEIIRTLVRQG